MGRLWEHLKGQDPRTLEDTKTKNLGSADKADNCKSSGNPLEKVEISTSDNRPMENNQAQTPKGNISRENIEISEH